VLDVWRECLICIYCRAWTGASVEVAPFARTSQSTLHRERRPHPPSIIFLRCRRIARRPQNQQVDLRRPSNAGLNSCSGGLVHAAISVPPRQPSQRSPSLHSIHCFNSCLVSFRFSRYISHVAVSTISPPRRMGASAKLPPFTPHLPTPSPGSSHKLHPSQTTSRSTVYSRTFR
jgi:hypothetical protein